MAKIWPCYEDDYTVGDPWKEITLKEGEELLDLHPTDFEYEFINRSKNQSIMADYQGVLVKVSVAESAGDWKPGIY